MNYYLLDYDKNESLVLFTSEIKNFDVGYKLLKGISVKDIWPNDAEIGFSEVYPKGINLTNIVHNILRFLFVSDEIKKVIESENNPQLEFLPINIKNHKGKLVADNYWVVNIIQHLECVDRDASDYEEDIIEEDLIEGFRKLVISNTVDKANSSLFRMKEQPDFIVFREDLVKKLKKIGVTGGEFLDATSITSFGL